MPFSIKKIRNIFQKKVNVANNNDQYDNSFVDVHYHDKKNYLDWQSILDTNLELWEKSHHIRSGKKILMATNSGGFSHRAFVTLESFLSVALTLRHAEVDVLLCDQALPACLKNEYSNSKPEIIYDSQLSYTICRGCYSDSSAVYEQLDLKSHVINKLVTTSERLKAINLAQTVPFSEIKSFQIERLAIGEHAYAGTLRYFARPDLANEPHGEKILRKYFEASIITFYAMMRLFETNRYDAVCFHHGLYVPQGIVGEVARHFKIPVVNWCPSYRKGTFIFSHGDTYHHTLLTEPTDSWENINWNDNKENEIMGYLKSRVLGTSDWISYQERQQNSSFLKLAKEKKIDLDKPIIGMLTNVSWDAQLHYKDRIFANMGDWIEKTIRYFGKRKDLQLLIRIHPAELRGNISRQKVMDEINRHFSKLPENVFIIDSSETFNTYEAMNGCDSVIIYGTKTGVELAAMGIPVIAAGEAWIRNKDIVCEPTSESHYFELLSQLPFRSRLSGDQLQRARKYAYHFFFRRMIPLPFFEETNDYMLYKINLNNLADLLPNRDLGLDLICDGILEKNNFIYPFEKQNVNKIYD